VRLRAKPNFRSLGKRYGKRTPEVAAAVTDLSQEQLRATESGQPATIALTDGTSVAIEPEDVTIEREVASQWLVKSEGPYVVALDPELDEALRGEGFAREVVNRVQRLRKEAGYQYTTRIHLWIDGGAAALDALRPHGDFIQEETLARSLELGARASGPDGEHQLEMDGLGVVLGVRRYEERSAV
jgi:isoleucyl-tRNA synthetase